LNKGKGTAQEAAERAEKRDRRGKVCSEGFWRTMRGRKTQVGRHREILKRVRWQRKLKRLGEEKIVQVRKGGYEKGEGRLRVF